MLEEKKIKINPFNNFEIPKYMIESQKQSITSQYQGMMQKMDDTIKSELEKIAIKRAKLNLIYMKIADEQKINITDQDVHKFILTKYPEEGNELIKKTKKDEKYLNQLKNQMLG